MHPNSCQPQEASMHPHSYAPQEANMHPNSYQPQGAGSYQPQAHQLQPQVIYAGKLCSACNAAPGSTTCTQLCCDNKLCRNCANEYALCCSTYCPEHYRRQYYSLMMIPVLLIIMLVVYWCLGII